MPATEDGIESNLITKVKLALIKSQTELGAVLTLTFSLRKVYTAYDPKNLPTKVMNLEAAIKLSLSIALKADEEVISSITKLGIYILPN
ncbi:MAG: hypothetical protein P8N49_03170 [Opitutales bacterium]|nr:hypothetical protein [Opitutales bacterium]